MLMLLWTFWFHDMLKLFLNHFITKNVWWNGNKDLFINGRFLNETMLIRKWYHDGKCSGSLLYLYCWTSEFSECTMHKSNPVLSKLWETVAARGIIQNKDQWQRWIKTYRFTSYARTESIKLQGRKSFQDEISETPSLLIPIAANS